MINITFSTEVSLRCHVKYTLDEVLAWSLKLWRTGIDLTDRYAAFIAFVDISCKFSSHAISLYYQEIQSHLCFHVISAYELPGSAVRGR